jgi:O-antigen/teichoic acid export membrane protein
LIRVQAAMTAITLVLNAVLIPWWGITGAALSSAITNAATNTWYLHELRSSLRMSPYNRGYLRLLPPAVACITAAMVLRYTLAWVRPESLVIVLSGAVCLAVLLGVTLAMGLSADDKVILSAVMARFRS